MKTVLLLSIVICLAAVCSPGASSNKSDDQANGVVIKNDTCILIDNYLTKLSHETLFSGGLLIVKGDREIFSKGYGWADKEKQIPFTSRTLASIGSITKAFTAAAVLKLVDENKISLGDSLKHFFPAVPPDKAGITIHQLLTHSSGFHEFFQQDAGDYEKVDKDEFLKRAFAEPLAFKPGEKAIYSNVGMSILGIIIEQVSGLDYEQFLKNALLGPVGITNIGYHYPALQGDTIAVGYQNGKAWGTHQQHFTEAGGGPFWNLKANGGLEVSLNEMALWINALTNHSALSQSSVEKMFTPYIQEEGYNGKSFFGYGCNISQSMRGTKMIGNGGSNGIYFARLIRLPEEGVVFYMVTNESSMNANMVLPNVTQLYFLGRIKQDGLTARPQFGNELSKKIYDIIEQPATTDLALSLAKENLTVEDDMALLDVGRKLIDERKNDKALILYQYYTRSFPKIVVAWNDLGDVYQALHEKDEAIRCYKEALKIRPGNPRAKDSLDKLTK